MLTKIVIYLIRVDFLIYNFEINFYDEKNSNKMDSVFGY
jgi:hypothetical protein